MGLVVEKIPFGEEIVSSRTGPVVGVAKGFKTSPENGAALKQINRPLPDNSTDVEGIRATNAFAAFLEFEGFLESNGETAYLKRFYLCTEVDLVEIAFDFGPEWATET